MDDLASHESHQDPKLVQIVLGKGQEVSAQYYQIGQLRILCTGAVAMTDALNQFGFLEFTNGVIGGLGIGSAGLPFLAAGATVVGTNLFSGTAATTLFCSIFIPAALEVGFNPASMAILIPNVAVGILFPWAGASAGTAFASGFLDMKEMIKVGAVASLLILVVTTLVHLLFAPIL